MGTTELLITVSIIANVIVGIILAKMIKAQGDLINQYKDLVSTIDPAKIKSAVEILEQGIEMKHKILATSEVQKFTDDFMRRIGSVESEVAKQYNELMNLAVNILMHQNIATRETIYSALPTVGPSLKRIVLEMEHSAGATKQAAPDTAQQTRAQPNMPPSADTH